DPGFHQRPRLRLLGVGDGEVRPRRRGVRRARLRDAARHRRRGAAMRITLIGLDADDTLWHSEDGFHTVTGRFCELMEPYAQDPSSLATTLDMVERRNMALFGYGVKSFTLSMVEAAIEVSGGAVPAETIQQRVDEGRTLLARPVDLLEGVEEALAAIAARYRLVVI